MNDQNFAAGMSLRQRHLVGLAAVEAFFVGIHEAHEILRADAGQPHDHAGESSV